MQLHIIILCKVFQACTTCIYNYYKALRVLMPRLGGGTETIRHSYMSCTFVQEVGDDRPQSLLKGYQKLKFMAALFSLLQPPI